MRALIVAAVAVSTVAWSVTAAARGAWWEALAAASAAMWFTVAQAHQIENVRLNERIAEIDGAMMEAARENLLLRRIIGVPVGAALEIGEMEVFATVSPGGVHLHVINPDTGRCDCGAVPGMTIEF